MKPKISRALRYTIAFVSSGLLLTLLIVYTQRGMLAAYHRNLPYVSLADNIKNRSTQAHLRLEEILAGDESLDFARDVKPLFISSTEILQGAYKGQSTEIGNFKKMDDVTTLALLKKAIEQMEALTITAQNRFENRQKRLLENETDNAEAWSSSIEEPGGDVDQRFDETYEQFQITMNQFVSNMNQLVKADSSFLAQLSFSSTFLLAAFIAIGCIFFYKVFDHNEKASERSKTLLKVESIRVSNLSLFIENISSGNYDVKLHDISEQDQLGNSLTNLRDKLRKSAETDRRRNWATTGLAQIGGILRANYNSTTELYDNVIRFVVKYMECNQGGLFVCDGEKYDQYLELVACYAYDRKKFVTKRIDVGEGLIGQCYMEGEKMYLLDVPNEYISITSGLGKSNPTCILLVPMKVNDETFGIIELASFKRLLDYEIELVEKLAESIAATLSTVRANENTKQLLEKSQQQAEELRAQEEEMRQNLEELEATQEEISRRQNENENVIKAVNASMAVVEFDSGAHILHANQNFLDLMGYSLHEIKALHHRMFVDNVTSETKEYSDFWQKLKSGVEMKGEFARVNKQGKTVWISGNYTPMLDKHGQVVKIMKVATDITTAKQREQQYSDYIWQLTGKRVQLSNQEMAKQVVDQLTGQKGKIVHKKMEFQNTQANNVEITQAEGSSQENLSDIV
jgi:PAS domain S-box-containing protein